MKKVKKIFYKYTKLCILFDLLFRSIRVYSLEYTHNKVNFIETLYLFFVHRSATQQHLCYVLVLKDLMTFLRFSFWHQMLNLSSGLTDMK